MNEIEKYEFDRLGYLTIRNMLTPVEVKSLADAVDKLEQHALEHYTKPPYKPAPGPGFIGDWHRNPERGYHVAGPGVNWPNLKEQKYTIIEDFWNASPVFDVLLNHPKTMEYIRAVVREAPTINNSQIFIRYPGSATEAHMGGPDCGNKHRYAFTNGRIDSMMVRMIYFIHDVGLEQGAFAVVPSTHKSNYSSPYKVVVSDEEPGMIGLEAKAGDAILFTENLRHGGLTNRSKQARKTLHVGYGPYWMMSTNIATQDEKPYILPQTRERLSKEQNRLFSRATADAVRFE